MDVRATTIEAPGPNDGHQLPIQNFEGDCRPLRTNQPGEPQTSKVRGRVSLTLEGEVRWSSMTIMDGTEMWGSEGIQVGGVGSARGVLGTWFEKWVSSLSFSSVL